MSAGALLAIGLAGWVLVTCAQRDGVAIGKRLEHDVGTDRVNAARLAAETEAGVVWRHVLDSLARANTAARSLSRLEHRADSTAAAIAAAVDSSVPKAQALAAIAAEHEVADSLRAVVNRDTVGIRARDAEIRRLIGAVRFYADTAVPALERDRDWWKRRASSPCGLGGTVGVGVRGADAVAGFTCRISLPHIL